MNPRYFIGISLPDILTADIQNIQSQVLPGQGVMEPLVPHITLLHPNILMTLSPMYFVPLVKKAAGEHLPLTIELTQTAMFDSRVLYMAVKSPALLKLQATLVSMLPSEIQARYQVGREYKPHVTIVQSRPLQSLNAELIEQYKTQISTLIPTKFEVSSLTIFKSQGPRNYKIEAI